MRDLVTICVVVHNEAHQIERCLQSLVTPLAPRNPFEILLIDSSSTDGTADCVRRFAHGHPHLTVRCLQLSCNHLGMARAAAVTHAHGQWLAFIDADCTAPAGWMDALLATFHSLRTLEPRTVGVGGGNIPPVHLPAPFYAAVNLMVSTFLGSLGSIQARPESQAKPINHLSTCNVIYERKCLVAAGNFSADFPRVGEDLELSLRLRAGGNLLFAVPGLDVTHFHRPGVRAWGRKMFNYGMAQIHVASLYPRHLLGVKGLPLLAVILLVGTACTAFYWAIYACAFYLVSIMTFSLWLHRRSPPSRAGFFLLSLLFFVTHFAYAAGEALGVPRIAWLKFRSIFQSAPQSNVKIRTRGSAVP